jgi:hypothetical protein
VVLKVSPPAAVRLLWYERGLLAAEARYYRLVIERAPQVPVPRVLHGGRGPDVLDGGWWMVMTLVSRRSLADLAAAGEAVDVSPVRRDLGPAPAALHTVTGDKYGYDGGRIAGSSWRGWRGVRCGRWFAAHRPRGRRAVPPWYPLMHLVSPALYSRIEDEPHLPFLEGDARGQVRRPRRTRPSVVASRCTGCTSTC